jgi:hypothetical protein
MEENVSLAQVLEFDQRIEEPLREHLRKVAETWHLPADRLRASAVGQVVDRIRQVLSTPFHKILAAAWRQHPEVRAYCDPVEYPPDESHTLELAKHEVGWTCEPAVELLADGLSATGVGPLAALSFDVRVDTGIRAGLLTIRGGRFIQMETAELVVCAALKVEDFTVTRYELPVMLPGTLRFGAEGEPICPAAKPDEAAAPAVRQVSVPAIAGTAGM